MKSYIKHQSRFKKKRDDKINPLRTTLDYHEQQKREASLKHTAAQSERVYFIDEQGKKLQPTAEGAHTGDKVTRFRGILDRLPLENQILRSKDGDFIVKRVEHELRLSVNTPPKIFIVLAPV